MYKSIIKNEFISSSNNWMLINLSEKPIQSKNIVTHTNHIQKQNLPTQKEFPKALYESR